MKKLYDRLISSIEYDHFSFFSYVLLIFWAIAPIVEYIFMHWIKHQYTQYFVFNIYYIGIVGILEYIIYIYKKIKKKNIDIKELIPHILILILVILALIASICSDNSHLSFFGNSYRKEGFFVYIMYIGFILSASIIKDKKYIENIFKIIIYSALFITIVPLFKSFFTYKFFTNIYHNSNHYGYFLMISTMLSGYMFVSNNKSKKIIYWLIYVFLIHVLIRNDTFGCILAISITLLFSLIYSLITKYKRIDIIVIIITFIISTFLISHYDIKIGERMLTNYTPGIISDDINIFTTDIKTLFGNKSNIDTTGTGRWFLWKGAIDYIKKKPLTGGGMECLKEHYKTIHSGDDRPHNIILQVAAFIGIPGAIIYLFFIIYLAITNLKYIKNNPTNYMIYVTAMAYFISSLFGNSMYYTSPYFMILIGFLIGMKHIK